MNKVTPFKFLIKTLTDPKSRDVAKNATMPRTAPCLSKNYYIEQNVSTAKNEKHCLYFNKKIFLKAIEMQGVVFIYTKWP